MTLEPKLKIVVLKCKSNVVKQERQQVLQKSLDNRFTFQWVISLADLSGGGVERRINYSSK